MVNHHTLDACVTSDDDFTSLSKENHAHHGQAQGNKNEYLSQ